MNYEDGCVRDKYKKIYNIKKNPHKLNLLVKKSLPTVLFASMLKNFQQNFVRFIVVNVTLIVLYFSINIKIKTHMHCIIHSLLLLINNYKYYVI